MAVVEKRIAGETGLRAENTAAGQQALRTALTAKAVALVPLLRVKAAETERERRIPDDILAAMDVAQLFRLRAPKRFGGFEGDLRTYMDVVIELGRGCGSTSWVFFILIATAWIAAQFDDEAQHEVFGGNPDVRLAGVLAMDSRRIAGQGRLQGRGQMALCVELPPRALGRSRGEAAERSSRAWHCSHANA